MPLHAKLESFLMESGDFFDGILIVTEMILKSSTSVHILWSFYGDISCVEL